MQTTIEKADSLDVRLHKFKAYRVGGEFLGSFSSAAAAAGHVLAVERARPAGTPRGGWVVAPDGRIYEGAEMRVLAAPPKPIIGVNAVPGRLSGTGEVRQES